MTPGGVLLTGGASRRLGVDKATLPFDGETLATRAARILAAVCDPVIEVGPGVSGLPAVREDPPGDGPLAALAAGCDALSLAAGRAVVLLACDLPFVGEDLLRLLAGWPGDATVVPVAGDRPQYTCARYGPAALAEARRLLARGERALQPLADLGHESVPESAWRAVAPSDAFFDVDTPADLARLTALLATPPCPTDCSHVRNSWDTVGGGAGARDTAGGAAGSRDLPDAAHGRSEPEP